MSEPEKTLEELQAELETVTQNEDAWAKKRIEVSDQLMVKRTESYNPAVVAEARSLSINPDNYNTEAELIEGINIVKNQNNEESE